jgi:hypothetical protein
MEKLVLSLVLAFAVIGGAAAVSPARRVPQAADFVYLAFI